MNRLTFFVALLGCRLVGASEPALQVPPGFVIERVAGPPAISFPMFATLDDQGRLYVSESSGGDLYDELQKLTRTCRLSVLEDRDGDGRYELAHVFADKLTPSMGLAWHEGKLFVADPPDLVTLEDLDGDGRADRRTVVLTGFGHSDNGSLHGLTFGPDGWLYFTMGSPDGYDLRGHDGSHTRSRTGGLLRCRSDGAHVETVSQGFENLVEVTFLADGSIMGTLNWYQIPERGDRDALIQILEGSEFTLRPAAPLEPRLQSNTLLPPLALFPAVAFSGIERYRGGHFPPEMRDNLFSAQHNTRKIGRHRLTPKNASFVVENFDFVTTEDPDVHFSDVLEDADGSLLVVDTGSWYVQHCPTGRIRQAPARGSIYRVSFGTGRRRPETRPVEEPPDPGVALRGTNEMVLAAAARAAGRRGLTNTAPELNALLRSPSLALRLAAAEALAHCGNQTSVTALLEALAGDTDAFLEHALTFALHSLAQRSALISALDHPSVKVQRVALLLLDQRPFQPVPVSALVARLNAADERLRDVARWVLLRHPEWREAGATLLRQLLELPNPTEADRQALRQFLPLFHSNAVVIAAITHSLATTNLEVTDSQRARLLEALTLLDRRVVPEPLADAILEVLQRGDVTARSMAIRAVGALRIAQADQPLSRISRDPAQPASLRLEALREYVRRHPLLNAAEMDFVLGQLAPANNPTLRLAASEILASAKLNPAVLIAILKTVRGDPLISPASLLAAAERNSIQSECAVELLDFLAAGLDAGWSLPAEQLARMQAAVPEAQRAVVGKLLARLDENIARQRQLLAEFEPLLSGGDDRRGEKIFSEKAQCATCHRVRGSGGNVGPDLTRLSSIRAGRDILESLVLPSSTIAQGYETVGVTTRDGESYTGVQVGKSDHPLVLRMASGAEVTLAPQQIERIDRAKLSLMPEGLLQSLTRDEVRDLLAYLQQLK